MSTTDRDKGFARILTDAKQLNGARVNVGIQPDASAELRRIAAVQEFGATMIITPKQAYFMARRLMNIDPDEEPGRFWGVVKKLEGRKLVIPERSYLRATFDIYNKRLDSTIARVLGAVAKGTVTPAQALGQFGQAAEAIFKRRIRSGVKPRNAPLTVAVKGSDTPLVHHGHLLEAVRAVVTFRGDHAAG